MGRRELQMKKLTIKKFDLGYFPNQFFDGVPDGGSSNCKHVLFRRNGLRQFPGMDLINATQAAEVSGQGLHYMDVNGVQKRVAVFGSKFYEDVGGVWTDRTGAVVITTGNIVPFIDHQQNANKYLIASPGGVNPPFKWTGTGNAAVLGGSPPNFETLAKYHDTIFGSVNELCYFSDTGDPETWDTTNWVIPFEKDITCQIEHGSKLAVLMDNHIGSIQGYDYLDFVAEEKEIRTFGCVGKLAAKSCFFGSSDLKVIATLAHDGLWLVDEAFGSQKIFGDNFFTAFNQSQLSKSSMAYWRAENLLFVALPFTGSSEPNYLIVVNMLTGAFWPGPDIHANGIRALAAMRDDNGDEFVYYIDSNGYAFKFNMETTSNHTGTATEAIDWYWQSKIFDLENIYSFGESILLADAVGSWGLNLGIKFGLEQGDGNEGQISMSGDYDVLGSTFVLGASTLGGSSYVFSVLEGIGGFGRFLQIAMSPSASDSVSFNARFLEIHLHDHRRGGNDR